MFFDTATNERSISFMIGLRSFPRYAHQHGVSAMPLASAQAPW